MALAWFTELSEMMEERLLLPMLMALKLSFLYQGLLLLVGSVMEVWLTEVSILTDFSKDFFSGSGGPA